MISPSSSASLRAIIGRRSQQQDKALLLRMRLQGGGEGLLIIVADGMGGAVGGQMASELAVEAFKQSMAAGAGGGAEVRLRAALDSANSALAHAIAADRGLKGMGCTLIGAIVEGDRINWISVGDSLLLLSRDGRVERLNADHSMAVVLDLAAQRGEMTAQEAASSEQRHMLRSALTGETISMIDVGAATLSAGARLIAATDGILTLDQSELARLLLDAADAESAAGAIIGAVEARMPDDQDNLTLAVVDIAGSQSASPSLPGAAQPIFRQRNRAAIFLLIVGLMMIGAAAITWLSGTDIAKVFRGKPDVSPPPAPSQPPAPTPTASGAAPSLTSQEAPTNPGREQVTRPKDDAISTPANRRLAAPTPPPSPVSPTPPPAARAGKSQPTPSSSSGSAAKQPDTASKPEKPLDLDKRLPSPPSDATKPIAPNVREQKPPPVPVPEIPPSPVAQSKKGPI